MKCSFEKKGYLIGEGKPIVCVSITEQHGDQVVAKAQELIEKGIPMVEWRVDGFAHVDNPEIVKSVLDKLEPLFTRTLFLFTFRTKHQGGMKTLPEKKILYLNEIAAKSGWVDFVDLEFFEATRPEKEIKRFQKMGVKVIASHHDFDGTPDERIMRMLMDQMHHGGADIAKLAVMSNSIDDALLLLKLTHNTRCAYPELPLITISMGKLGAISRIGGEMFGSCITFGALGNSSAPGQLPCDELNTVLDVLHKNATSY